MITGVWITDDCTKVAVQVNEERIEVTEYNATDAGPVHYDVDVLGAEWVWLPVSPEGWISWIAVEQA